MTVNTYIDHTLLKPDATLEQIEKLIAEAKKYEFASVCVNPTWVKTTALISDSTSSFCPDFRAPILITISTSSTPLKLHLVFQTL